MNKGENLSKLQLSHMMGSNNIVWKLSKKMLLGEEREWERNDLPTGTQLSSGHWDSEPSVTFLWENQKIEVQIISPQSCFTSIILFSCTVWSLTRMWRVYSSHHQKTFTLMMTEGAVKNNNLRCDFLQITTAMYSPKKPKSESGVWAL